MRNRVGSQLWGSRIFGIAAVESERVEDLESQDQKCHLFKFTQESWFETKCGRQIQVDQEHEKFQSIDKKVVEEMGSGIWDRSEANEGTEGK